jgi:hypothetical protein
MLKPNKEAILSWKETLVAGWYDHKSPAVNPDLVDLWAKLGEELEPMFPELVLWVAPASDSSIGMDVHKLLPGKEGKPYWSDDISIVHMYELDKMEMWDETSGETDDTIVPFDKEVLCSFLKTFSERCKK